MPPKKPTKDAKNKTPHCTLYCYKNFALSVLERRHQEKRGAVSAEILKVLEEGYVKLLMSGSRSLLKKYLTREIFYKLKNRRTPIFGSTLLDCVQSGFDNHDSSIGVYAPDPQAYSVFAELFDPIIEECHKGFNKSDKHPPRNFGDTSRFGDLDPMYDYIISTRLSVGRSIKGYPFAPCMTSKQYRNLERSISTALGQLDDELKGNFYPLSDMSNDAQQRLINKHYLFIPGDRFLQAANACRYWPTGRGIYYNENKTFLVWCNEEDHIRIISMERFGHLGNVYRRLVAGISELEKRLPFSHHSRLGFLTVSPTNLGTSIHATVRIKLPKLAANKAKLEGIAKRFNLQIRDSRGEYIENDDGIYDISNQRRLGPTEYETIEEMYNGITELIEIEKSM